MFKKLTTLFFKLLIISLIFGQLSRIPVPLGGEGAVYLTDVLMGLLFVFWACWRLIEVKSIVIKPIDFLIAIFIGFTLLSLINAFGWVSKTQFLVGFFYWFRTALYLSLFKITTDLQREIGLNIRGLIEFIGVLFAVLGLVQYFVFPDFSKYIQHGWDPHYYRVLSTYFDPNFAGLLLAFTFLFILWLLYETSSRRTIRLIELAIVGTAFLLTFSRSSYLALAVGLAVFSWIKDRRIILAMLVIIALAFFSVPRFQERVVGAIQIDETAKLRLVDYEKTWQIIQENPLLGVGYNTFRYAQESYGYFRDYRGINHPGGHAGAGADNSLLFIWATGGIFSLVTLVLVMTTIFAKANRNRNKHLLWAILVCFVVHFQFVNSLFLTWLLAWFMIVVSWLLELKPFDQKTQNV